MSRTTAFGFVAGVTMAMLAGPAARAAEWPAAKEGQYVVKNFAFHTGEVMPELRIHYRTVGEPTGEPVLVLHGTAGSGASMLTPGFAGELFGPGQPLDATKFFIILPDALGTGKSTRPSDGLKAKFPRYNYTDMVEAQHRLVTEGLGIRHLRLVIGNSMGGMQTWLWGVRYPGLMDGLVPMASQPTAMSGRNWIMRRMLVESIRSDPTWNNGDYKEPPRSLVLANAFYGFGTSGGNQRWQKLAPTRAAADKIVEERLAAPLSIDANDFLWQWDSSRDYDASPGLGRIEAAVLAINSADDERNPPELGGMEREMKRLRSGKLVIVPGSEDTAGHGTTASARFWKADLKVFLEGLPRREK